MRATSIRNDVFHEVLTNGTTVIVVENPTADIVATRCFLRGGTSVETPDLAGIVHLAASLMTRGTSNFSSQEIAEQVESIGASLGTEAAADYFLLSFKTITADFVAILKLAIAILQTANFPESELELERRLTLQAIRSQKERPFNIAYEQLQPLLYGPHPYGFPSLGTPDTIAQLRRADLQHYHQQHFSPERLVVSIAGRIHPEEAVSKVAAALEGWQHRSTVTAPPPLIPSAFQAQMVTSTQPTQQAIVMLGYPAPPVSSEDYAALKLITTYLGNGLSSRLFVELREKRGLAYEVSAFYPARLEASQFVTYMGTAPQNTQIALSGIRAECDRLTQELLSEEELQTAKNKLLGQYALGKQTNGQIAHIYGWYETLGLGTHFDRQYVSAIEAVTVDQIQQVAGRYLSRPAISIAGPTEALETLEAIVPY